MDRDGDDYEDEDEDDDEDEAGPVSLPPFAFRDAGSVLPGLGGLAGLARHRSASISTFTFTTTRPSDWSLACCQGVRNLTSLDEQSFSYLKKIPTLTF